MMCSLFHRSVDEKSQLRTTRGLVGPNTPNKRHPLICTEDNAKVPVRFFSDRGVVDRTLLAVVVNWVQSKGHQCDHTAQSHRFTWHAWKEKSVNGENLSVLRTRMYIHIRTSLLAM